MRAKLDVVSADLDRRIKAFETNCYRRMLGVSYRGEVKSVLRHFWQRRPLTPRCSLIRSYQSPSKNCKITNTENTNKRIHMATGQCPHQTSEVLSTVKRGKLSWFGLVCWHYTLPKTILKGTVEGACHKGRPRKSWKDNIKEWTDQSVSSLLRIADDIAGYDLKLPT